MPPPLLLESLLDSLLDSPLESLLDSPLDSLPESLLDSLPVAAASDDFVSVFAVSDFVSVFAVSDFADFADVDVLLSVFFATVLDFVAIIVYLPVLNDIIWGPTGSVYQHCRHLLK